MNTKQTQGVTVFEVLAAIAIFGLVTLISIASYQVWRAKVQISNARQELVSALTQAQQYAMASAEENNWGIHLDEDQYVLFNGSFYNESDPDNRVTTLRGALISDPENSFDDGAGGRTADVVFTKFTGTTYNTGTIAIISDGSSSVSQTIVISATGAVE